MAKAPKGNLKANTALLRHVAGFGDLDEATLREIAERAEYRHVLRGEVLIREGQPADNLYIVLKGRFVVLVGDSPIAEITMGEPIGELAFFAGGTRTASVVAARNSNVMCLSRAAYDELAARFPGLSNGILAALSRRLAQTISGSPELRPMAGHVCSVFPAADRVLEPRLIDGLRGAFAATSGWTILGIDDCPPDLAEDHDKLTGWLEEREAALGNLLLLCTDPTRHTAWAKVAASNSDTVMIALEKTDNPDDVPAVSALEKDLFEATLPSNIQLALYRAEATQPTTGTAPWLAERPVALHHHVALDAPGDIARLARFIRGEAVGLVLCGGGSFGTAHMGAIKLLRERGYDFDFVGGTSVGSAMAGALVIGHEPGHVMDVCEDIFLRSKAMKRLTVPKFSVLDHHRLDGALKHHFGGFNIEDAPINFFAVATSLTDNDVRVLRRGPMWQAIRASASVPGVFPPVVMEDGEVLIDGGLLDNAPLTIMRDLKAGPNLVLNFLSPKPWRVGAKYADLPTRGQALLSLFKPRKRGAPRYPTMFSILSRAMVVNARKLLQQTDIGSDILLNIPTLRKMSFMDWTRGRELFDAAYGQMSAAMDQLPPPKDEADEAERFERLRAAVETINASGR